jgi:hypothetical protein
LYFYVIAHKTNSKLNQNARIFKKNPTFPNELIQDIEFIDSILWGCHHANGSVYKQYYASQAILGKERMVNELYLPQACRINDMRN